MLSVELHREISCRFENVRRSTLCFFLECYLIMSILMSYGRMEGDTLC